MSVFTDSAALHDLCCNIILMSVETPHSYYRYIPSYFVYLLVIFKILCTMIGSTLLCISIIIIA